MAIAYYICFFAGAALAAKMFHGIFRLLLNKVFKNNNFILINALSWITIGFVGGFGFLEKYNNDYLLSVSNTLINYFLPQLLWVFDDWRKQKKADKAAAPAAK